MTDRSNGGPQIVFALYRPHAGRDAELRELLRRHFPTLQRLELVTGRAPVLARAQDGTYVEVFEWRTAESAGLAHHHPEVAQVWEAMGRIADFPTLDSLAESKQRFSHLQPVEL